MPVNISVTTRRDPRDRNSEPRYHATIRSKGRIKTSRIASEISTIASVNNLHTTAVLEAFMNVVPERLADGHIVDLGGFGTFRISVSSEGASNPRDVTPQSITDVRILFRPGELLMKRLSATVFEKIQDQ
jgi:predicted histone-like DNA-binding protein